LDEPTLEVVDPDEVIDPALKSVKAFMGAFLTASEVPSGWLSACEAPSTTVQVMKEGA